MCRSNRSFNVPRSLRQIPGHLTFLKLIVQIPPYPNQSTVQMPHTRVHSGDQMPPSRGDLKTFHIIRYVGALKAESATVCNRQYSFYSNLFCNCFIIKKTIKHTCSWQILIRIVKRNLNNLVLKY